MTAAVLLRAVSKGYPIYRRTSDRLRELLTRRSLHQTFWALREVDLEVPPGQTFGLVGENGAGKSTLLKLVAGTSRPSAGELRVTGRVAALLELGAGFHPEQSGRDNVVLMAALAGIGPEAMADHYRRVVEFSELPEDVLERPVKTYSSGMFVRLAFASATAVDPEILVIDEALSVGDMHFQKKSLDRIMAFREQGKTVLFCSHNLYQVRSLCVQAAWLREGRVEAIGPTEEVVSAYESYERAKEAGLAAPADIPVPYRHVHPGQAPVRLRGVALTDAEGRPVNRVESFQDLRVEIQVESWDADLPYHVGMAIVRNDRENIFGTSTHFQASNQPLRGAGQRRVRLHLDGFPVLSGDYGLSVYVLDDTGLQVYDSAELVYPFRVGNPSRLFGMVAIPHRWEV